MHVTLELLRDDHAWMPARATPWSAGFDVRASLRPHTAVRLYNTAGNGTTTVDSAGAVVLLPRERALIPLGFKASMPDGMEAQLRPRSGLALKLGLTLANAPGTIDADFPDEWAAIVINHSEQPITITDGERIAQVVFHTFVVPNFQEGTVVPSTSRAGGYGSTGVA